ncbi:MAG: V-type ATP synthase subunit I [Parachlamydiaceae bacterium]|nr:V-type ATP synthase subunit I [Parachlamydiaceae bacterium]
MRIDLKKVLFIGLERDRKAFFESAQMLGLVHFISEKKQKIEMPLDVKNISEAIKILRSLPVMPPEDLQEVSCADELVIKILHLKESLDRLNEEDRILSLEISRIAPFGNYSKDEIKWIEEKGHRKIQFFCAKQGFASREQLPENIIYVATEYDLDYFISINAEARTYDKMVEIKPEGTLSELEHMHHLLNKEKHDAESRLKHYAKYNVFLRHALVNKLNSEHLSTAVKTAHSKVEDKIFSVEAWIPQDKMDAVREISEHLHVHTEEISIESTDVVPTHLENEGLARIGEDLVNIYDTPSTSDKDPSLWVLFFFALFFAIIIGDAGYGLILLLGALYIRYKTTSFSSQGLRINKLVLILSTFCIAWGILTTSFFGISFAPDNSFRKFSALSWLSEQKAAYHFTHLDDIAYSWIDKFPELQGMQDPKQILMTASQTNFEGEAVYEMLNSFSNEILLEFALFIGVIHICLSFIRNLRRNMSGIGWIMFIVGGFLYFPMFLAATTFVNYVFGADVILSAEYGLWLMFGGIGVAVVIALFRDKILGLLEMMNVIQIFADIMSYLRLYALGLSGALVVSTLNEFASGMNIVLAALLLIVGHIINLGLCLMGGTIHGLRLNFLEWYHYSFEGGGKTFNPLKKIEMGLASEKGP